MLKFNIDDIVSDDNEYFDNIEALFEQLEENEELITKQEQKIDALKRKQQKPKQSIIKKIIPSKITEDKKTNYQSKEVDVSSYIKLLNCSQTVEDLASFLPKVTDNSFNDIINGLMLHLQSEFVLYSQYIDCIDPNTEIEELKATKKELENIAHKKALLLEYKESFIDEQEETVEEKQTLFYLQTAGGNYKILNDIKQIPIEYYDKLYVLFNSLYNGRFKNLKALSGSATGKVYNEVRLPGLRVTFMRLSPSAICVLSAFVKRTTTSRYYKQNIMASKALFEANRDYIISNMDNSSFIEEQSNITKSIFDTLKTGANKVKVLEPPIVGGDKNE